MCPVACTICKIQENANITHRTTVAQIKLSQIERSICQIERSICDTQLLFTKHRHTNGQKPAFQTQPNYAQQVCMEMKMLANIKRETGSGYNQ